jgi:hypothetical protein
LRHAPHEACLVPCWEGWDDSPSPPFSQQADYDASREKRKQCPPEEEWVSMISPLDASKSLLHLRELIRLLLREGLFEDPQGGDAQGGK